MVDNDTWGYFTFSVLKRGLLAPDAEQPCLQIDDLRYLGLLATDDAYPELRANSLLKNAVVAYFNLAKCEAKLRTARRITTYVAILSSHPCDVAAC